MGCLGRETWTVHSISVQTSQEEIKFTKAKEQIRACCPNMYIQCLDFQGSWISMTIARLESNLFFLLPVSSISSRYVQQLVIVHNIIQLIVDSKRAMHSEAFQRKISTLNVFNSCTEGLGYSWGWVGGDEGHCFHMEVKVKQD